MRILNFPGRSGLILSFLALALLFSCASAAPRPAPVAGPYPADLAMAKLAQDLLVTLPSPLRLGLDDFYLGTSRKTSLGRYLGQLFVSALVTQGGGSVTPVERQRLDAALAESNYDLSQLVKDPAKFSQVGNFLPAQAIASAAMTVLPDRLSVSVRVFSASTGEIIAASTVAILRDENTESLIPPL